MHFCIFFISLLASFSFRIVPLKKIAEPFFHKGLRRRGSRIHFVSFLSPNGPLGVGHDRDKREKHRGIFWVLPLGPLQSRSSQNSFLHFLHSVLFIWGTNESLPIPQDFPWFLLAVEMMSVVPNSSASSQTISNPSSSFSIFDRVYHLKDRRQKTKEVGVWKENDHLGSHHSLRFPTRYTLPNVKWIASGKQPHSTGRSARWFVTT